MSDKEIEEIEQPSLKRQVRDIIATAVISPHLTRNPFWDAAREILSLMKELGYRKPSPELREKIARLTEDRFRQPAESAGLQWDANFNYMLADEILALIVPKDRPEICCYCGNKADGAMLGMGASIAHADCAIHKLNELLDYDYDGKGKPIKIVGYIKHGISKDKPPNDDDRICPCDMCGKMRSKDEGGTTFTVCDECWDKIYKSPKG